MRFLGRPLLFLFTLGFAANAWGNTEIDELLAAIDAIRVADGVAGVGLVVVDQDQVLWSGGVGLADWQSRQPLTENSYVRIGSITKVFTGLALLKAHSAGHLRLDQPIHPHAPAVVQNPWVKQSPVTTAQLLEHTAGLTDMVKAEWDHNQPLKLAAALQVAPQSRQIRWRPGLHSSYSNSGAGVAAFVFEQATQMDFEKWIDDQLLTPMKMPSATFAHHQLSNLATGYDRDGRTPIPYWHTLYRPFGGLNVKLKDMRQLLWLFLNRGVVAHERLFTEEQIARTEVPKTTLAARSGLTFGYGLGNYAYAKNGFIWHGHGGDADGYLSHFAYNRDSDIGYFVVINAFKGRTLRKIREQIERFATQGITPKPAPNTPQPRGSFDALVGDYRSITQRFPGTPRASILRVSLDQGRLYLHRGGRREHLVPVTSRHFRRRHEPVATLAFVEFDGEQFLQAPFGNYQHINNRNKEQPAS